MYIPKMLDEALAEARKEIEIEKLVKIVQKNITGKNKWLCSLGFHKEKYHHKQIFKSKRVETSNVLTYCERCGKVIDYSGSTTFGPMKIQV